MTKIARAFSTVDESMILSMLSSAEIEAVADSTNFQRVQYGTMYNELTGTVISVDSAFEKEAREIVRDFIENRKRLIAEEKPAEGSRPAGTGKKTFMAVIAALFAPAFTGNAMAQGRAPLPELID
jgi:hypothetical protein